MGSNPILEQFQCFQWEQYHYFHRRVVAVLTLMLGLNGPLNFCNNFEPINLKSMRSHSLRAKKISYCEGEDNRITITIRNLPDGEVAIVFAIIQTSPPPHPDQRQPAPQTRGRHPLPRTRGRHPLPPGPGADTPSPGPEAGTPPTRGRHSTCPAPTPTKGRHSPSPDQRQSHPWTRGRRPRPGRDGHCSGRNASHWNAFLFWI